jgi:hypothetical protein
LDSTAIVVANYHFDFDLNPSKEFWKLLYKIIKRFLKLRKYEILYRLLNLNSIIFKIFNLKKNTANMSLKMTKQDKYEVNQRNGFYMWAYNSSMNTVQHI